MKIEPIPWLLLIASIPTVGATPRMRLWRAIRALGCASLRDVAYLLPDRDEHAVALAELARQTGADGGEAWVVNISARSQEDEAAFLALFDRTEAYAALNAKLGVAREALATQAASEVARVSRRLRKELGALQRIDYFPNGASVAAQSAWADFQQAADAVLSPGEPHPAERRLSRLDRSDYQGRVWATRCRPWVDRVASAWLIRRFIDPAARFLWLDTPAHCPADALGFDFDDAAFTHVGPKVTFEVLLASFGLDEDTGLDRLAALVHCLDVGGAPNAEAAGFGAILSGARSRLPDDDALLGEMSTVLDSLYSHYKKDPA